MPDSQTQQQLIDLQKAVAELQRRITATEPSPPTNGSFGGVVAGLMATLGKPDSIVMGSARHAITIVGTGLAAKGYADKSSVVELSGALMALAALLWSIFSKYVATHWLNISLEAAPGTVTLSELPAVAATIAPGKVTPATVATAVSEVKP